MESKDTNLKDAVGIRKAPMSTVPAEVMLEVGLAMLEGARKYGRHNYRAVGVRASVYYDAAMRHLMAWWEGEDTDPDSGLSHLVKAMACLVVIRDSMVVNNWQDDRPPRLNRLWLMEANCRAGEIIDRLPDAKEPYTQAEYCDAETRLDEAWAEAVLCDVGEEIDLPAYCDTEGHLWGRHEGKSAVVCLCCGVVPELKSTECEHDWMALSMPDFEGYHCRKCSQKKPL